MDIFDDFGDKLAVYLCIVLYFFSNINIILIFSITWTICLNAYRRPCLMNIKKLFKTQHVKCWSMLATEAEGTQI